LAVTVFKWTRPDANERMGAGLLNVAVSRAKARLYVIGRRADCAKRRYFDELSGCLPAHVPAREAQSAHARRKLPGEREHGRSAVLCKGDGEAPLTMVKSKA
jgi:hypothetical protein